MVEAYAYCAESGHMVHFEEKNPDDFEEKKPVLVAVMCTLGRNYNKHPTYSSRMSYSFSLRRWRS
jgi:hypothetical protein